MLKTCFKTIILILISYQAMAGTDYVTLTFDRVVQLGEPPLAAAHITGQRGEYTVDPSSGIAGKKLRITGVNYSNIRCSNSHGGIQFITLNRKPIWQSSSAMKKVWSGAVLCETSPSNPTLKVSFIDAKINPGIEFRFAFDGAIPVVSGLFDNIENLVLYGVLTDI